MFIEAFQIVFQNFKKNGLFILGSAIPLIMFKALEFYLSRASWGLDPNHIYGEDVVNFSLYRFAMFCFWIALIAVYSHLILLKTLTDRHAHWWNLRIVFSLTSARIFAFYILLILAALVFYALIFPPLLHLLGILNWGAFGSRSLILVVMVPLGLWLGHYLTRLSMVVPAWVNGDAMSLRGALHFTEDRGENAKFDIYIVTFQLELALIALLFLANIFSLNSDSSGVIVLLNAGLVSLALSFALLLLGAFYQLLSAPLPVAFESA